MEALQGICRWPRWRPIAIYKIALKDFKDEQKCNVTNKNELKLTELTLSGMIPPSFVGGPWFEPLRLLPWAQNFKVENP